jgi:LmbE family N-acetylglucosaminyl deacetylase
MNRKMNPFLRAFAIGIAIIFFCHPSNAQESAKPSLVLMCLSAHPDDEDGAALAYYGKLDGVKTYSIFYTRGEGGQNEIGSELYEDLGALRTKETRAAAAILGSEVHFLGFPDFGFSKTAKETFTKWGGKDSVLARVVLFIRALKPDVIITNHDTVTTKPNRQHGNHQAVGITAYEAFEKAADPHFHPEQFTNGIGPWQARKLFFRAFRSDSTSTSLVTIDTKRRDTSGTTMEQIAVWALNKHRSQGLERLTVDSLSQYFRTHRYSLVRSNGEYPFDKRDLFSGISPSQRMVISVPDFPPLAEKEQLSSSELSGKLPSATFSDKALVGLVKTYDNTLEETLKLFKVPYRLVDSAALANGDLNSYTTILLDLRTYFYRTDAVRHSANLLQYVHDGGNIVCFYHKLSDWNGKGFAPYPIVLTAERVTEEDAPVSILQPHHPLFNEPNLIAADDWGGWVQERNIYLPSDDTLKTSAKYERLLAMSDTDERQPSTSILWTRYGKGTYTYISLALYRQLRIHQGGSIKLLFNLLSQPKN